MISTASAPISTSAEDVGGKAASLFRLSQLGCAVPRFFVIMAEAYRAHPDGRVSDSLRQRILDEWRSIGGEAHAWAVRSSGLAEDSADHSFAGVFSTILDVRGPQALIDAVEACWASHRSVEASAYREARDIQSDEAMAVVVQRMIDAEWAGVSFTADPLTQALSVTVVNAVRGGADKLVSGLVNPDEIRVETASGRILNRSGQDEDRLPQPLLEEVVRTSNAVAKAYGFPQDLEWAADNEGLWLLQSRPITTVAAVFYNRQLEPWREAGQPDAPERVWSRAYADEIWSPPVSPLFYDVQHIAGVVTDYLKRTGDDGPAPPDVFKYFRAAAYCDVDLLHRMYACLPKVMRRPGIYTLFPPERRAALRDAPWNFTSVLRRLWQFEVQNGSKWGIDRNHHFLNAAWPVFVERARPLLDIDLAALDDAGLEAHTMDVWMLAGSIGIECGVAVLYYAHDLKLLLSGVLDRWSGDGEELFGAVSAGLSASETVREADRIWEIAATVREAGAVDAARGLSWAEFSARADASTTVAAFNDFLRDHRHRGANYKDVLYPRWGDDPEMLWAQVRAFLDEGPRPSSVNQASASRRVAAQRKVLQDLRGPLAPVRRAVLKFLFKYNAIYASLRDNHRYYYDQVWWMLRRIFVEKGRRLQAAGLLASPDDIFFLDRREHAGLASGELAPALAADRIRIRREEWRRTRREQPPKFLRRGYAPDDAWERPADASRLSGLAASPGQARGPARIVYDVSDLERVGPGDILVTRQTDPSWTPAFARLGGLVLETGGVLAHGASLCREFGLPCVTAVEHATQLIRDGDIIAISGSDGAVDVVKAA